MVALFVAVLMGGESVTFTTIARGAMSGVDAPRQAVVRTLQDWQALWADHAGPEAKAPAIDFSRRMVVGVFLGARPTGGFAVEIVRVDREGDALIVRTYETRPQADDLVVQVLTAPFHLIELEQFAGTVRFEPVEGGEAARRPRATTGGPAEPTSLGLDPKLGATLAWSAGSSAWRKPTAASGGSCPWRATWPSGSYRADRTFRGTDS